GSNSLTSDISQCLKVSIPEAERLKIIHGDVNIKAIDPNETIEITTLEEGRKTVNKLLLCQIIEARMSELFQHINKNMSLDLGPDFTMVIGGGGSLLRGLGAFLNNRYLLKVREGLPEDIKHIIESSAYATAVGLVLFGVKTKAIHFNKTSGNQLKSKVTNWVRNFF
ncbi:hypothetical protein DID80_07455, partial [Candidatus Marinamargulisbacteria bacterium SCGC AAA071-K20]